jgi:hypothetical protein
MAVDRSLLVGRDRRLTARYLGVAVLLFAGTLGVLGLLWLASRRDVTVPVAGAVLLWAAALVVVGAPAVQAYRNDALLVSVALGVSVPLAFYLVLTAFNLVYPSESVAWGVGAALQFGVPAGTLGFLLGAGSRRLRERRSADGP